MKPDKNLRNIEGIIIQLEKGDGTLDKLRKVL